MSAPVTEAHRQAAVSIFELAMKSSHHGAPFREPCAQLIANSEAKAVEQANAHAESLLSAAKNAIPASEHPAEPTVQNWAWQIRNLGDDRRLVYAERDRLRQQVANLTHSNDSHRQTAEAELAAAKLDCGHAEKRCDAAIASWDEERERALREGARVVEWRARAERAEADAARLYKAGTDQWGEFRTKIHALDAELAAERARLDWMEKRGPWESWFQPAKENSLLLRAPIRAAIDAAMKEEAK